MKRHTLLRTLSPFAHCCESGGHAEFLLGFPGSSNGSGHAGRVTLPVSEVLASAFYSFGPVAGSVCLPPLSKINAPLQFPNIGLQTCFPMFGIIPYSPPAVAGENATLR